MPRHSRHSGAIAALGACAAVVAVISLELVTYASAAFHRATPVAGRRNTGEVTICSGERWTWKNPFRVTTYHDTRITSVRGRTAEAYPNMGSDGSLDVRADLGGAFTPTPTGDTTVDVEVVDFNGKVTGRATLIVHVIDTVPPCRRPPKLG